MLTTAIGIRRLFTALAVTAAALAMLPLPPAHALAPADPPTPTAPAVFREQRLERVWERQQVIHDRLGVTFDRVERRLTLAQQLIDRAQANGKDVSAIQNALNDFSDAVKPARPAFESMQGIISSHQGFDADGNVTDITQAAATVSEMGEKLREIRSLLFDAGRAVRDAIRAFREANPVP